MSPTPASELFDHFRVELDAGNGPLFRGGERITGNVKIQLKKEIVIQAIRIQFKGRSLQKDSKKGRDVEKVIFDKDYMLLERPPGNEEAGNFSWKADFEYSLPFQYILPLGCPSSFEGPDGFVRYFTRVTFETSGSKAIYLAKKYFSVYDLDTVSAIDPRYQEPYTYRHTFASGGCCCKRQVYMEFVMPKRVFYAGEDIEGKMLIDNIGDERIANDIQCNIVERTAKPEVSDEDALKYPARIINSTKIDGTNVEKRKNQIVIGSLVIPAAAPISLPNAVALAALPKDKASPQLSPDDQASKLFEHESIISQSRKEPVFRVHYALQLLIGKFIIEVPFVLRPVESEEVRNLLKSKKAASEIVQLTASQVATKESHKQSDKFAEPDEHNKIVVEDAPVNFVPVVPVYVVRPVEEQAQWPTLGTYENDKLVWHPDKKPVRLTKEQKIEKKRLENEAKAEKKRREAEKKGNSKAKRSKKELLVITDDSKDEGNSLSVNVESVTIEPTRIQPAIVDVSQSAGDQQQPATSATVVETNESAPEKPKKKTKAEIRAEKQEAAKQQKEAVKLQKEAAKQQKIEAVKQQKEAAKQQKEAAKQQKIEAAKQQKEAAKQQKEEAVKQQKETAKQQKEAAKQQKEAAKLQKETERQQREQEKREKEIQKIEEKKRAAENKKIEAKRLKEEKAAAKKKKTTEEEPVENAEVPGTSDEPVTSTVVTETIVVEQKGDEEPTVSVTRVITEQIDNTVTTVIESSEDPEAIAHVVEELNSLPFEPQPIIEEIVFSNGHHLDDESNDLNGHHHDIQENGANGNIDGEMEENGHVVEDPVSLKKKNAEASEHPLPTEA